MSQSTIIFGYLVCAFAIFVVARGELPTYLGFFGIGGAGGAGGTSGDLAQAGQAAQSAVQVASLFG